MNMPNYFLAKTDPETFSIEDFESEGITTWDGVHNHQAISFIKQWNIGDIVIIYHSMGKACLVGVSRVITEPIKDENDIRGISWKADLELVQTLGESLRITLKEIKNSDLFNDWFLVRQSRLSVMPIPIEFLDWIRIKGVKI
jgi:predicted RNA-binding protein with PUA-like domain